MLYFGRLSITTAWLARCRFEGWSTRYQAAAAEPDPGVRASTLAALADEVESDLHLVGVAAIEDKLQVRLAGVQRASSWEGLSAGGMAFLPSRHSPFVCTGNAGCRRRQQQHTC